VLLDYPARIKAYKEERDALEGEFLDKACQVRPEESAAFSRNAFAQAREATDRWTERVRALPTVGRTGWIYRRYWTRQNRRAGIVI
jgi:hypothetical protein